MGQKVSVKDDFSEPSSDNKGLNDNFLYFVKLIILNNEFQRKLVKGEL